MAIQTQVWANDIASNIFPQNSWESQSISDDAWVDNKTVNLPQAGAVPNVVKNRTTIPATSSERVDTIISYDIHEFTSDPTTIRDVDAIEVSYDKRADVLSDHISAINKKIANELMYRWCPTSSANILRTTGSLRPANTPGATGNRKMLTISDVVSLANLFDDMDIDRDGRRTLLLPSHMLNDLTQANFATLLQLQATGEAVLQNGLLMELAGFKLFQRGKLNVLRANASVTPVPIDPATAGAATDNAVALAWHPMFVRRAKGGVKVYADEDKPEYYGSIFSAMARAGGSKKYSTELGVAAIIETT